MICIFTCSNIGETCAKLWPQDGWQISTFFLLLFGSIDGAVELASSRNKVHAKKRKMGFSRNFCSAIYTYSTVFHDSLLNSLNRICLNYYLNV